MQGKLKKKGLTRVAVYLNKEDCTSMAQVAEKLGFRTVGIPIQKQKEHGFADEWEGNTDGIAPMLKFCFEYYRKEEPRRLARLAEIGKQIATLEGEANELERPAE